MSHSSLSPNQSHPSKRVKIAEALAPFAPGRSFVSVERVAQALGRPRPNAVGSSDNYRAQSSSYVGGAGQLPAGPAGSAFAGTASPYSPGTPAAQLPPQMTGTGGYGPPQGATAGPAGSSTNAIWAASSGGAQVPTSKAPLFAGLGFGALLLFGIGGVGIYLATHHAAAGGTPSATATTTATAPSTTTTTTAATSTATATDTSVATQATATQTAAPTTHATGTHTATAPSGTGKPPTSATVTATATPPPTVTATATAGHVKKPNGTACAVPADCTSGNCAFDPFFGRGGGNVCK